jgi:mRNA interferase RelE/StbE
VSAEPYELGMTRPARRAISELLPEDVTAAAVDFITGPLLTAPYRIGKPLRDSLAGFHSARLGSEWRATTARADLAAVDNGRLRP